MARNVVFFLLSPCFKTHDANNIEKYFQFRRIRLDLKKKFETSTNSFVGAR